MECWKDRGCHCILDGSLRHSGLGSEANKKKMTVRRWQMVLTRVSLVLLAVIEVFFLTIYHPPETHTPPPPPPPPPPSPEAFFEVNPAEIRKGQPVTLSWSTTDATEVAIDGIGPVSRNGSMQVNPTESFTPPTLGPVDETITYTLTAKGPGGTWAATASVSITGSIEAAPPTASCSASPTTVFAGEPVQATMTLTNASEPLNYNWKSTGGTINGKG